jgi:branched-chain amino acid aminotransferase
MPDYAYHNKQILPIEEAKIGVMTHALHYGTACFEGIRGNWNSEKNQIFVFRMREHYERLRRSCHILRIGFPYDIDELCDITCELVRRSGHQEDVYIRPLVYKSAQVVGVRMHNVEDDILIFVTPFGPYLDVDKGARCCISSWRRVDDNMIPARAKVTGIYVNSAMAKTEAFENGYDEAIFLNQDGHVSEGSGENIFILMDGKLVTPSHSDNILVGITRECVITLAKEELGIDTVERQIDRSELYIADECFMTGTAAHVTPVVEIDHRSIGTGKVGEITKKLQALYCQAIRCNNPKYQHWCTPV